MSYFMSILLVLIAIVVYDLSTSPSSPEGSDRSSGADCLKGGAGKWGPEADLKSR